MQIKKIDLNSYNFFKETLISFLASSKLLALKMFLVFYKSIKNQVTRGFRKWSLLRNRRYSALLSSFLTGDNLIIYSSFIRKLFNRRRKATKTSTSFVNFKTKVFFALFCKTSQQHSVVSYSQRVELKKRTRSL